MKLASLLLIASLLYADSTIVKAAAATTIAVNLLEIKDRIRQARAAAKAAKKTVKKIERKIAGK